jgi:hypothetical protein
MSGARFTIPKLRLAALLRTPGGLPVEEALAAAEANTATLRPECMAALKELLEEAEAIAARLGSGFDEDALGALYATAVRGIGLGEVCGAASVDAALTSLCDLVDHLRDKRRYDAEAIGVHLRAWRLLMSAGLPPDAAQQVLAGLHKVSALYARPAGA